MPFSGTYEHTLDAKNRLTVPAKFRAALAGGVTIAKGLDPCATIWITSEYHDYSSQAMANVRPMTKRERTLERFLGSASNDTELDAAGRIMVPSKILEHAGLSKEVVIVGTRRCLEVWDRSQWEAMEDELAAEARALAEDPENL